MNRPFKPSGVCDSNRALLQFDYAIRNDSGLYYNGNAYGDSRDWTAVASLVFTYSEAGAHRKVSLFPVMFANCQVVRYL